jgi:superfamily I DNA/RNA helicase
MSLDLFEKNNIIDFTDMLYITLQKLKNQDWNIPFWLLFTNIYYDEFQDASLLHQKLIRYFKRNNGRFIFIYDKNQAIYGFAGADCRATDNVDKLFAPVTHFKLPINYRCGYDILKYVNQMLWAE